jgi:8-oxo-dGTP pyrophosphatase MutT (NUDIX family)
MDLDPWRWRVTASRVLVEDRWIRLRADTVVTPQGAVLDPYYVLDYADWVHVVALTDDGRIVMVRQYRHAIGAVHLELPGGVMDAEDEGALVTAARELMEETGHAARELRHVITLCPNPATHTNRVHTVLATGCTLAGETAFDHGEDIAVEILPVAEALAAARSGGIQQSTHVASLLQGLAAAGVVAW